MEKFHWSDPPSMTAFPVARPGYPFIFAFLIAVYYHRVSFLPVLIIFSLILINQNFYKFFIKKRGVAFAVLVVPMHILYYVYCEISFILGLATYYLGRKL